MAQRSRIRRLREIAGGVGRHLCGLLSGAAERQQGDGSGIRLLVSESRLAGASQRLPDRLRRLSGLPRKRLPSMRGHERQGLGVTHAAHGRAPSPRTLLPLLQRRIGQSARATYRSAQHLGARATFRATMGHVHEARMGGILQRVRGPAAHRLPASPRCRPKRGTLPALHGHSSALPSTSPLAALP